MAKRKHTQAFDRLLQEIVTFINQQSSQFMRWLLRTYIVMQRWQQQNAGFVLPTTVFMLMVVFLVVTAIMFRTFSRTNQVIGNMQQQEILTAASPAIDRAKSKIEYLMFPLDSRVPAGIPNEAELENFLGDDSRYTLPDETRVGTLTTADGSPINAWSFDTDTDGDGQADATTIYTILTRAERQIGATTYTINPAREGSNDTTFLGNSSTDEETKADYFLVSNGPLSAQATNSRPECQVSGGGAIPGWFESGSANLFKAFQVYAVTVPKGNNTAIATIQYQQDRAFELANKWGAWFRYDWEVYPGDPFNWNGSVHTEGSMFLHGGNGSGFRSRLISSDDSCFIDPMQNSELSARGQIVAGRMRNNAFSNSTVNIDLYPPEETSATPSPLNQTTDSVDPRGSNPINISTDPLTLLTQGISKPRSQEGNSTWLVDGSWENSPIATQRAKIDDPSCPPYVDDIYRADNRYGPKPSYSKEKIDQETGLCVAERVGQMGTPITANPADINLIEDEPPAADLLEDVGLDGYWERRARDQGLRIIVGQRLELGNLYGWNLDSNGDSDADYSMQPPDEATPGLTSRPNEGRQLTTLRDNLAAVQATAVYHHTSEDGYFPVAYVATTVHPGNLKTLQESSTFNQPDFRIPNGTIFSGNVFGNDDNELTINFFTGQGTNGWEFETYDAGTFTNDIAAGRPLGDALRNLANFAGDPDGAFPPRQENNIVHPYPLLTMWGDFSNLRRSLNSGTYASLSIADKTNIQTAAGMLGMLAYNISYLEAYDYASNAGGGANQQLDDLDDTLNTINTNFTDGNLANGEFEIDDSDSNNHILKVYPDGSSAGDPPFTEMNIGTLDQAPPDAYLSVLDPDDKELAQIIHLKEQIERDRQDGFKDNTDYSCDEDKFGATARPGLATLCPTGPKFPSLHYIFPISDHGHDDGSSDPYVEDAYIRGINNNANLYQAVDPSDVALQPKEIDDWVLPRQELAANQCNDPAELLFDDERNFIDYPGQGQRCIRVTLKDSAIFDGREMMSVRLLNLDLDLLRSEEINDDAWLPDSGLVYSFREDALREDGIARPAFTNWGAYRTAWNSRPEGNMTTANTMNVSAPADPPTCYIDPASPLTDPSDPNYDPCETPNGDQRGISPKPVDYYPDPDRRPYGFRLKNGRDLTREGVFPMPRNEDDPNQRGMSFISDNPVYIQGDFNLHSTNGDTENLAEFTNGDLGNGFYTRNNTNTSFAQVEDDHWRPTEIITDAINILSSNFCDGTVESGILNNNTIGGCTASNQSTSYQNSHYTGLPSDFSADDGGWICENPFDLKQLDNPRCDGPIKVFRNGDIKYNDTSDDIVSYEAYRSFTDNTANQRSLTLASNIQVNSILVSGIIPTRREQGNGGFHNFPRLNEYWGDRNLGIFGSMIQLNFSNYATGPYDQDAWETTAGVANAENANYYLRRNGARRSPNRLWGYDVGLQFQAASPVAKRMVNPAQVRNEYYREPPANDPYICKLRDAVGYPCSQ